jgi:hypothetical protein
MNVLRKHAGVDVIKLFFIVTDAARANKLECVSVASFYDLV